MAFYIDNWTCRSWKSRITKHSSTPAHILSASVMKEEAQWHPNYIILIQTSLSCSWDHRSADFLRLKSSRRANVKWQYLFYLSIKAFPPMRRHTKTNGSKLRNEKTHVFGAQTKTDLQLHEEMNNSHIKQQRLRSKLVHLNGLWSIKCFSHMVNPPTVVIITRL